MNNLHIKVFVAYLNQLSHLLNKLEKHVHSDPQILKTRLTPDMLPLMTQVEIAASFALRTSCPIAQTEVVSFKNKINTFSGVQALLKNTVEYLIKLDEQKYDLAKGSISDMAGPAKVTLTTLEFLHNFAMPNFFFHISMVYAISKANGISVTKGDFDGYHDYPVGFSFEKEINDELNNNF